MLQLNITDIQSTCSKIQTIISGYGLITPEILSSNSSYEFKDRLRKAQQYISQESIQRARHAHTTLTKTKTPLLFLKNEVLLYLIPSRLIVTNLRVISLTNDVLMAIPGYLDPKRCKYVHEHELQPLWDFQKRTPASIVKFGDLARDPINNNIQLVELRSPENNTTPYLSFYPAPHKHPCLWLKSIDKDEAEWILINIGDGNFDLSFLTALSRRMLGQNGINRKWTREASAILNQQILIPDEFATYEYEASSRTVFTDADLLEEMERFDSAILTDFETPLSPEALRMNIHNETSHTSSSSWAEHSSRDHGSRNTKNKALSNQTIINTLRSIDPYAFVYVVKAVLEAEGYLNVRVTTPVNDKGVDIIADVEAGLTTVREVIQVKRNSASNKVGRPTLDALRGSLYRFNAQRGMIVTTSKFTKNANQTATEVGAAPITLVDGSLLVDLIIKHDLFHGIEK